VATLTGISIQGINANDVYSKIVEAGVSDTTASEVIGAWLLANAGKLRRQFTYHTDFPATEADCVPHFVRSFVHVDWFDGQNTVQAQQTPDEEGFNVRFHKIEADFDSLSADVAEAFLCIGNMRAALAALLGEIKDELNTIEGDLADLKNPPDATPGRIKLVDRYAGTTQFLGKPVDVFRDDTGQLVLTPSVTMAIGGGFTDPQERLNRVQDFAEYAQSNAKFQALFTGQPVTKEQVIAAVGGDTTPGGLQVADALAILPDGSRFSTPDTFVQGLADREGLALKTSGVGDAAVTAALGTTDVATVSDAAVTDLQAVPVDARAALAAGGVNTVGALAKLSPTDAATLLTKAGVQNVSATDAAGWIAGARALTLVR